MCTCRCHTSHSTSAGERRSSYNASCVDAGSAVRCLRAVDRSCSPGWLGGDDPRTRRNWDATPTTPIFEYCSLFFTPWCHNSHARQLSSFMSAHVCSQLTTKACRNRRKSFNFRSCIFMPRHLVLHFHVVTFGPAFSGPAFSGLPFSAPPLEFEAS